MVALKHYEEHVRESVKAGADVIISGAGLPMELPKMVSEESGTKIAPIVSSRRAANLILKMWAHRYGRTADFIVIEGPQAGGPVSYTHLVTYTFKLRDGIKWSDGKDVTAGDFEYAWKRLVDPATAADYSYMLDCVVNANEIIAGEKDASELAVKAVDDKTFEVTLVNEMCIRDSPWLSEKTPSEATIQALNAKYGLDQPKYIQLGKYLKNLAQGDFGTSIKMQKNRPVLSIIKEMFPVSAKVGSIALLWAVLVGVPLGCLAAFKRGTWVDSFLRVLCTIGIDVYKRQGKLFFYNE